MGLVPTPEFSHLRFRLELQVGELQLSSMEQTSAPVSNPSLTEGCGPTSSPSLPSYASRISPCPQVWRTAALQAKS